MKKSREIEKDFDIDIDLYEEEEPGFETLDIGSLQKKIDEGGKSPEDLFDIDKVNFDDLDLELSGERRLESEGLESVGRKEEDQYESYEKPKKPQIPRPVNPRVILRWQPLGYKFGKVSWGLDIGLHTVKVVGIRKRQLCYVCVVEIAQNTDLATIDAPAKHEALRSAVRVALGGVKKISKQPVRTSIGNTSAVARQIEYPLAVRDKLLSALKWEAKKYIPYEPEEVLVDAQILGTREDEKTMSVLLGAVPKEQLNDHMGILSYFSIIPQSVTVDSLAVIDAIKSHKNPNQPSDQKHVLVIDVGFRSTDLCFFSPVGGFFTLSLSIAGDRITRQLASMVGITYTQAERLKCGAPLLEIDKHPEDMLIFLKEIYEQLYREIDKSITFYRTHGGSGQIDQIFLCGGGAFLAELPSFLSGRLGKEVVISNKFDLFKLSRLEATNLSKVAAQCTLAVGLALKG